MIILDIEQNTPEWHEARAGLFTASSDFQVLCTGNPTTKKKLFRKKAAERITGKVTRREYMNFDMIMGKVLESDAIDSFEFETGLSVQRVGFCKLNEWVGCSPDGLIGESSGLEVKAKDIHTHLDCLLGGYDTTYKWQVQGNMWVTDRKTWWFKSYNPDYLKDLKHSLMVEVPRDEIIIKQIELGVKQGIEAVEEIIKKYNGL